jgi:uncharacterized protein (DUF302 family)
MTTTTKLDTLLDMPMDTAVQRLREELQARGFGVLTEIDVQATLRSKLNEDFYPYRLFGVCNPALAYRVLQIDPSFGVFLPCTIAVYDTGAGTELRVQDPNIAVTPDSPVELAQLAAEVRGLLAEVVDALKSKSD